MESEVGRTVPEAVPRQERLGEDRKPPADWRRPDRTGFSVRAVRTDAAGGSKAVITRNEG
jgi:hypothetical protein